MKPIPQLFLLTEELRASEYEKTPRAWVGTYCYEMCNSAIGHYATMEEGQADIDRIFSPRTEPGIQKNY